VVRELALVFLRVALGIDLDEIDVHRFAPAIGSRPVFLIHGTADTVVLPGHSREIYDLLSGPRDLWFVPEGEHEKLWNIGHRAYEARILRFLNTYATPAPPAG